MDKNLQHRFKLKGFYKFNISDNNNSAEILYLIAWSDGIEDYLFGYYSHYVVK